MCGSVWMCVHVMCVDVCAVMCVDVCACDVCGCVCM